MGRIADAKIVCIRTSARRDKKEKCKMAAESKLSVIVPVYNVKEYLNECIDSILAQTYQNLEVLLIVNAPTDGSEKICEEYAEKDKRIKLLYIEENHGVYSAWYLGGISATGEYTTFVDADDYIDGDYFQSMMNKIFDCDIICSYHSRITNRSKYWESFDIVPGRYSYDVHCDKDINEIIFHMQLDKEYIFPATWAKIYSAKLLKDSLIEIGENPVKNYELGWPELLIVYTAFLKSQSIRVLELFGYNYRMRQGSEGRRVHENYLSEINSFYVCMKRIFENDNRKCVLIDGLQKFVLRRILDASYHMNFSINNRIPKHFIPFPKKIREKKIALYSAHDIAIDYYRQILRQSLCCLSVWVSRNWQIKRDQGLPVEPVEKLLEVDFDYLVIAVNRESTARGIKEELVAMGVEEEKILWEKPIHILDQGVNL